MSYFATDMNVAMCGISGVSLGSTNLYVSWSGITCIDVYFEKSFGTEIPKVVASINHKVLRIIFVCTFVRRCHF